MDDDHLSSFPNIFSPLNMRSPKHGRFILYMYNWKIRFSVSTIREIVVCMFENSFKKEYFFTQDLLFDLVCILTVITELKKTLRFKKVIKLDNLSYEYNERIY